MQDLATLLGFAFGLPLVLLLILSGRIRDRISVGFCMLALLGLFLNSLALSHLPELLPQFPALESLRWNWVGKTGAIALSLIFLACLPKNLKEDVALWNRPRAKSWTLVFVVAAVLVSVFFLANYFDQDCLKMDLETLLFQASLPGLDEELLFRGTLLACLNRAFSKPWSVADIKVGWGSLPVIIFFGLAHGFSQGVEPAFFITALTGFMAVSFIWLKEYTNSIWVPVIVHNLANLAGLLAASCP